MERTTVWPGRARRAGEAPGAPVAQAARSHRGATSPARALAASALVAAVVSLAACAGTADPADTGTAAGPVALGVWGTDGQNGATLTVTATGATLETSCGEGTVAAALLADAGGAFQAGGTYGRIGGAPPPDGVWPKYAATFKGKVTGETLSLTVQMDSLPQALGPYLLTHGHRGQIIYCP